MASSFPDPFQMWRDALTKLENDTNKLTTGAMHSPEVMRSLNQFATMNMGMQQVLEKVMDGYLRRANLPSRKEVADLADALQRIEAKLDQALGHTHTGGSAPTTPTAVAAAPRPARTRKPPTAAALAPAAAPEPAPTPAPKKRARSAAKKG
ncbi:MAG: poly(R)-hydroxyalkanoic acid synthase subunit PhaE [Acidovorax sp.]